MEELTRASNSEYPYIATGRLPLYEGDDRRNAAVMFASIAAGYLGVTYFRTGEWVDVIPSAVGLLIAFLVIALITWISFKLRMSNRPSGRRAGRDATPSSIALTGDPRAVEVVVELERQRRFRLLGPPHPWTWRSFIEALDARSIPRPRTIIDEAARAPLGRIPLPEDLLEPEGILESRDKPRARLIITIGMVIAVGAFLLWIGMWWLALLSLIFATIISLQLPEVRDATRRFRLDQRETVVGLGSVTDRNQRRWTVENAVMLVKCKSAAGPLMVTMIGEAGDLTLPFTDGTDADLIRLWQRWNHPQPRPELTED